MSVKVTTEYGKIEIEERQESNCSIRIPLGIGLALFVISIITLSKLTGIGDEMSIVTGGGVGIIAFIVAIFVLDNTARKYYYLVTCHDENTIAVAYVYKTNSHDDDIKRVKLAIKEMELRMKQQCEQEKKLRDELMKGVE